MQFISRPEIYGRVCCRRFSKDKREREREGQRERESNMKETEVEVQEDGGSVEL